MVEMLVSIRDRHRAGRGTTRAEDAQGTPTQSHISPSILVYEENRHSFLSDAYVRYQRPRGGSALVFFYITLKPRVE